MKKAKLGPFVVSFILKFNAFHKTIPGVDSNGGSPNTGYLLFGKADLMGSDVPQGE
jgi:hypothetical protein